MFFNSNIQQNWAAKFTTHLLVAMTLTFGTLVATKIPAKADAPAPRNRLTIVEIRLLRDLIDGHNFAVQMAQVCVEKASRNELRSLCKQVIEAQQQEIQEMRSWLNNWYGINYQPTANNFGRNVVKQLESLNGSEFEIEFMKTLTSHHWGAIEFAGEIIDRAYHNEFIELASNVVIQQAGEITQLRRMLREVYGIQYNGATPAGSSSMEPEPSLLAPGTSR
jgi:uncharacterized protein (DUF305 family)